MPLSYESILCLMKFNDRSYTVRVQVLNCVPFQTLPKKEHGLQTRIIHGLIDTYTSLIFLNETSFLFWKIVIKIKGEKILFYPKAVIVSRHFVVISVQIWRLCAFPG